MEKIKIAEGVYISCEYCDYDTSFPPEIAVCLVNENGVAIQDICLVRKSSTKENSTEVLVWADECSEDYTNKFEISTYVESENN